MRYKYSHFIKENVAPAGAKRIVVCDPGGREVAGIPLGRLERPAGQKLFSFGLISDIHVTEGRTITSTYFDNALTFFEERGCAFCAHAGDITNVGFWSELYEGIFLGQFAEYKRIRELHPNMPVYGVCGNHESYNRAITENLPELVEYTGNGLCFTVAHGGELFIFAGQTREPNGVILGINDDAFAWVKGLLESNPDKRCHVFAHYYVTGDSGNAQNCYDCYFGPHEAEFKSIMAAHGRAIHYHGHTHNKFQAQQFDESANYTEKNGYPSVHIPSVGKPREMIQLADGSYDRIEDQLSSQGYTVDVYDDRIVLNGWDFLGGRPVALGTVVIRI